MPSTSKKEALLAFIETYRSLPELWDVQHIYYTNRTKKSVAYEKLVEKLKVIEPDATRECVVKKINSIRSAFRKEWRKVNESKKSGASGEDVYAPNLWYFKELTFLIDQDDPDTSESTICEADKSSQNSLTPSIQARPQTNSFAAPAIKRKCIPTPCAAQDLLVKAPQYLETEDDHRVRRAQARSAPPLLYEDDECLTLAKGYTTKLRKLTPLQLMFADRLINETLFHAQMGLLTPNSCIIHPNPSSTSSPSYSWDSSNPASSSFATPEPRNATTFVETLYDDVHSNPSEDIS